MRRSLSVFAAFSFLFLPLLVGAQTAPKPEATRTFVRASTAVATLPDVLEHFKLYDRELRSLTAGFRQGMKSALAGSAAEVEGTVAYRKPERLRIEHYRPERQTVVSDGKDIWIYRRAFDQVIQSDLAEWKSADPAIGNLMRFGGYAEMLKTYDVVLASGPPATLTLTPKSGQAGQAGFTLKLELDPKTLFPTTTVLIAGSVEIRTVFDEIVFNPELDEKDFAFTPPPGADVFRNFKPPRFQR